MRSSIINLKHRIILPTITIIIALLLGLLYSNYAIEHRNLKNHFNTLLSSWDHLYHQSIQERTNKLGGISSSIMRDQSLTSALLAQDREELQRQAGPLFRELRQNYNITHFYFHTTDRTNLLRVHAPQHHGDIINRFTAMEAERTQNISHGIELGPLGTLTLRSVSPWFHEGRLIGYVELGEEVENLFSYIKKAFRLDTIIIISKAFIEQEGLEKGDQIFNRKTEWEQDPALVVLYNNAEQISTDMLEHLLQDVRTQGTEDITEIHTEHSSRLALVPIIDVARRNIGHFIVAHDFTKLDSQIHNKLLHNAALLVTAGISLSLIFYYLVIHTERQVAQANQTTWENEEKFRGITTASQDAILLVDDQGKIIYWNPAAHTIFGYSEQEAVGQDVHLLLAPPSYRGMYSDKFAHFAQCGEGPIIDRVIEVNALHKDGHEFPIELCVSALKLGEHWHAVGNIHDISARKAHEQKLIRANRALAAIHASNMLLTQSTDETTLLDGIVHAIIDQAGYKLAWIGLFQEDHAHLIQAASASEDPLHLQTITMYCSGDSSSCCPAYAAASTKSLYIENNIHSTSDNATWRDEAMDCGYHSAIALPLLDEQTSIGALSIYSTDADAFHTEEVRLLQELAGDLAYGLVALRTRQKHKEAEALIAHQASHDPLTDLPNRTMIMQAMERSITQIKRHGGSAAILFIDLDEFKLINDTLGHRVGDELLQQVARRFKSAIRAADMVARQGGDEFIVLLTRPVSDDINAGDSTSAHSIYIEATHVAERLIEMTLEPFQIEEQEAYIGASIGISLYPHDAQDQHTLLQYADSAMYRAKEMGRNGFQFYSKELSQRQQQRLTLSTSLHKAIDEQQFRLFYQPIVELDSGSIVGVESLIRWQKPDGVIVSPAEFLQVAEDTGLIIPIGDWVFEEACNQQRKWSEKGYLLEVAINLSVRQLRHTDIVTRIHEIIARTRADISRLKVEITESAISYEMERMESIMNQISDAGILLALDDFGTGYSSLSRLKRLPVDTLKIDKSFVDGIPDNNDDAAIINATIQLGHSLGMQTLAEGIENAAQWHFLQAAGCKLGQGYHFSRPVPAHEIDTLLEQGHRWQMTYDS